MHAYDLLLIKPSVYHYPKILSDKPYERCIINFHPDVIAEELLPILSETRVRYRFESNKLVKRLYSSLSEMKKIASTEDMKTFSRQAVNMLLLQLKYAPHDNENAQIIHPTLSKILQYIDEHLDEALDAKSIANRFFVSTSWVFHIFQETFTNRL